MAQGNNYKFTFEFRIDNKVQYFGIFLGSGDNAIKEGDYYNDLIKIGEPITAYYDNNLVTKCENITRLIYRLGYIGKPLLSQIKKGEGF